MARRRKKGKRVKRAARAAPKKQKKKLSQQQEFEIMKMVLDKFLWLGFIVMLVGVFVMLRAPEFLSRGLFLLALGALVLLIFTILLVKEYEVFA